MDFGPLRALTVDLNFDTFGVDATVIRPAPDDTPIEDVRAIWPTPPTVEVPIGSGFTRREATKVIGLRKSEVPTLPTKTRILAPEYGSDVVKTWQVDGIETDETEHWRAWVVEIQEP